MFWVESIVDDVVGGSSSSSKNDDDDEEVVMAKREWQGIGSAKMARSFSWSNYKLVSKCDERGG